MFTQYWNAAKIERLIDLVHKSPALWSGRTQKSEKDLLWKEIAEQLDIPVFAVNRKYNELVSTYRFVYRKVKSIENYKPTWKYFQLLSFLKTENNDCSLDVPDDSANETNDTAAVAETTESQTTDSWTEQDAWIEPEFWTDQKKLQFIKLLKENPKLFIKHLSYEKEILWKKVADEIGIDVEVLKLQKQILSKQFSKQFNKTKEDPNFKSNWKYYESLMFLADIVTLIKNNKKTAGSTDTEYQQPTTRLKYKVSIAAHWNCKNTIKFLELIHARPVIWDDSNSSFIETTAQKNAWEEIVKEVNLPVNVLKDKFKSLCSTYYSVRKEIAKDPLYVISWIYFSHMEFLPMPENVLKTIAAIRAKKNAASSTDAPQKEALVSSAALVSNENTVQTGGTSSANSNNDAMELHHKIEVNPLAISPKVQKTQKRNTHLASSSSDFIELDDGEVETAVNKSKRLKIAEKSANKNNEIVQEMQISSTSKSNDNINLNNVTDDVGISNFLIFRENKKTANKEKTTNQNLKFTSNKKNDEYDNFGEVVANEMRKISDYKQIQKVFKQKVKQALYEAQKAARVYEN